MLMQDNLNIDSSSVKKKEKDPTIWRSEIMPVLNPKVKWEKDEQDKVRIVMPLNQTMIPSRFLQRRKKIQLDVVGSIVWELCDGKNTIKDIIDRFSNEYKLLPNEAETALNSYLNQLAKRGLIAFAMPEEASARLRAQRESKHEKSNNPE